MKNIQLTRLSFLTVFILILAALISSCVKDTDGAPENIAGNPVLISVDPPEASGGSLVTITGTGLGDMRSAIFDGNGSPAGINSTLNTETNLLIRVPDTAASYAQNIILTNGAGKTLTIPFFVLRLANISTAFPTDFQAGSTITITGNNLDDVTSVVIDGTTDEATIVSQSQKSMVITMPASAVYNGKLSFTNPSGTTITSQVFVNIDKAAKVFTDDYNNGFLNYSWGGTYSASTDYKITGTSSMKATYGPGWGAFRGTIDGTPALDITGYTKLAFWTYGASNDPSVTVQVSLNWAGWYEFTVPANVWTYFAIDLATVWPTVLSGNSVTDVIFQLKGDSQTIYFDNVVFIK